MHIHSLPHRFCPLGLITELNIRWWGSSKAGVGGIANFPSLHSALGFGK